MNSYVIAVRHKHRKRFSLREALSRIADIPDLEVIGADPRGAAMLLASEGAIFEVSRRLAKWCYIEAEIRHHPLLAR